MCVRPQSSSAVPSMQTRYDPAVRNSSRIIRSTDWRAGGSRCPGEPIASMAQDQDAGGREKPAMGCSADPPSRTGSIQGDGIP